MFKEEEEEWEEVRGQEEVKIVIISEILFFHLIQLNNYNILLIVKKNTYINLYIAISLKGYENRYM